MAKLHDTTRVMMPPPPVQIASTVRVSHSHELRFPATFSLSPAIARQYLYPVDGEIWMRCVFCIFWRLPSSQFGYFQRHGKD
jgi:hypothetical protein